MVWGEMWTRLVNGLTVRSPWSMHLPSGHVFRFKTSETVSLRGSLLYVKQNINSHCVCMCGQQAVQERRVLENLLARGRWSFVSFTKTPCCLLTGWKHWPLPFSVCSPKCCCCQGSCVFIQICHLSEIVWGGLGDNDFRWGLLEEVGFSKSESFLACEMEKDSLVSLPLVGETWGSQVLKH